MSLPYSFRVANGNSFWNVRFNGLLFSLCLLVAAVVVVVVVSRLLLLYCCYAQLPQFASRYCFIVSNRFEMQLNLALYLCRFVCVCCSYSDLKIATSI